MKKLVPIENQNQRVLLTSQLAEEYGTTSKVISNNFNNNKEHYIEGKHYYRLEGEELKRFKSKSLNLGIADNLNKLYLWTERGALLHAKSLNTQRAWNVYDQLVDNYFEPSVTLKEFPPKASSIGEGASVLKLVDKIMVAQKASAYERAKAFKQEAEKLHIPIPDNFIQPRPFEQMVLTCISTIKVGNGEQGSFKS